MLFPEFVSRVVRQGMEEESILPDITATVTNFDGMDYRSIESTTTEEEKKLKRVEEGAQIPQTTIHTTENLVRLQKRGRMLVAPYEAIRFQRLDPVSYTHLGTKRCPVPPKDPAADSPSRNPRIPATG